MRRIFLALAISLIWMSIVWADCKPLDYYTRSVKLYIHPKQGKQDLKAAEKLLAEALQCYPKEGEVLYTAGLLYAQKKEFAKMAAVLNDAIKYSPKFKAQAETLKALTFQETFLSANDDLAKADSAAKQENRAKNFNEAIKLYHGCIIIDSTATGSYRNLSYIYSKLGNKDSAMYYDKVLFTIAPDSAHWGYIYGVDLVNREKYPEAIEVLEKVVKRDSTHWDAWGLLGQLYANEDSLAKMAVVYEKLSRQFPDSAEFSGRLADYELRQGFNSKDSVAAKRHYRRADTLYAQYLSRNASDSTAWYNRGLALTSLKLYAKAAEVLKKTGDMFPGYADAWEALSGAYAQMGNKAKEAKEAYEKFKKLRGESGQK